MKLEMKPREYMKIREEKHHPSNSFLQVRFLQESTGGGVGAKSLLLSLGIIATDISQAMAGGCKS